MARIRTHTLTAVCVLLVAADLAVTTGLVLLVFRVTHSNFLSDLANFTFSTSVADIWLQSILRGCLSAGGLFGICYNTIDAKIRIGKALKAVKFLCTLLELHVVVKLLYWAEDSKEILKGSVWGLYSTCFLLNIAHYGIWHLFAEVRVPRRHENLTINCEDAPHHLLESENGDSEVGKSSSDSESETSGGEEDSSSSAEDSCRLSTWAVVVKLLKLSRPDIPYLIPGFLSLILAAVGEVFLPLYTGRVIDGITIRQDYSEFISSIAIMSGISLASGLFSGFRGGLLSYVGARFVVRLQGNLYAKVLDQEIAFYDSRKTGEIISRLTADTTKVSDQLTLNINVFLRNTIKLIGVLVFMFKLSWKLTILTLVGLPLVFEIYGAFGSYYEKLSEAVQSSLAAANESAAEVIASIRTVKSFGAEDVEKVGYRTKLGKTFLLKRKEAIAYGGFICVNEILDLAFAVLVLFYGGHLVLKGDLSGGHLVSFVLYDLELADCLEGIGDIYTGLMEAVGAARKVFFYLDREPQMPCDGSMAPPNIQGNIQFSNVTFAYPTRPELPAVKNLSFTASPGEVVALVGPSGGGKSTIINLLEHFYEPDEGQVYLDGIPIAQFEHKFYHSQLGLVAQEPVLFARSIKENIMYGMREEVPMRHIEDAAMHANVSQFINDLPKRFDTETGEKGIQLSGGQKQRVAIARALIRNPSVLLLDEATSALDSESEYLVQDAINKNLSGRTVIIIAHRLSTIEKADKILVIDKGELVEQGTHAELCSRSGAYASLARRQLLNVSGSHKE